MLKVLSPDPASIDRFLAASLKSDAIKWPADWTSESAGTHVVDRAVYHGIALLLAARKDQLSGWPPQVRSALRDRAVAQAIWELRHREVLERTLEAIVDSEIPAILLKGTALAYDVYTDPASRARGDTDLLVSERELDAVRKVLGELGFFSTRDPVDEPFHLQESWSIACADGSSHTIDLHWQVFNTPALRDVLGWNQCLATAEPLPRLAPHALRLERPAMLLHACAHSAMHYSAPYFVDGVTYYGGDRLIWTYDIHLLASAFGNEEWDRFCASAEEAGLAPVCLEVLLRSKATLGSAIPESVLTRLGRAGPATAAVYLQARQFKRSLMDLAAIRGWRARGGYLLARLLPPEQFMRAKYPGMARLPVAALYGRRLFELFRKRLP